MHNNLSTEGLSIVSSSPIPIQLCNNTDINDINNMIDRNNINRNIINNHSDSWCLNCTISDPVIVKGNNFGKYILWNIKFYLFNGGNITIKKRYNDFERLHKQLLIKYGKETVVNNIPPKSGIFENRFSGEFLERRRNGLEYWLNSVVLDPIIGYSTEVRQFVLA